MDTRVTRGALVCGVIVVGGALARAATIDRAGPEAYVAGPSPSLVVPAHEPLPYARPAVGPVTWLDGGGLTPPWLCEFSSDCDADYLAFPTLAAEHASLLSLDELDASLTAPPGRPAPAVGPGELHAVVREALGVGFLLDRADSTPLQVTHLATAEAPASRQDWLLVEDPLVGAFPLRVLAPPGVDARRLGDRPAILFLTGHLDTADSFVTEYDGLAFADAGYVVVTLEARADDAGPVEDWVAQTLLVNGFTLLGLRAYEALLALRVMRSMEGLDPSRLGLLGHSGGGTLVNAMVRLDPAVAAAATDHHTEFHHLAEERFVLCETISALAPWAQQISDPSTAPMPMKRVEYGWPDGAAGVIAFFDRALGRNIGRDVSAAGSGP